MKKSKVIKPAQSLVDVSPQEMRRRSTPFETNAQVKSRYEQERALNQKLLGAMGKLADIDETAGKLRKTQVFERAGMVVPREIARQKVSKAAAAYEAHKNPTTKKPK